MTVVQWLSHLYQGWQPPAGFIEFRLLPSRRLWWIPWPSFEGHPDVAKLDKLPTDQNVYFGAAIRMAQGKGGAADCHPTHLLWADLDLKGTKFTHGQSDVENMTPEDLRQAAAWAFRELMELCTRLNLPPLAVTYTGHGLHVQWAREARSTREDTETLNRRLALLLSEFGADLKVYDQARILRVPGSLNLKNPARPLTVEVWHVG